ncbi:AMIN domain-containing protein [Polymorphobacter arshaanensis]|uniref:N-acetylmuramoyl-L-alanine amidase n=1 Tax=Glacieibacterium arshaanense TaxID=2511025 RepID=A0A4Y9ENG7_9SPHN|nr:N-acetylmuramoyl-L-alanine amidase [Polymorphobacter arshaanensis]TFU03616.1 AMIN domain-containing protein [Polymorphobacter arshaanensis]
MLSRLVLMFLLLAGVPAASANLRGIEIGGGARPEITVVLDGAVAAPKSFVLDDPLRLIVDFDGVAPVRRSVDGGGVVVRVRAGQFDPQTVRLVIELSRPMTIIAARQAGDSRLLLQLAPVSRDQFNARLGKPRMVVTPFVTAGRAATATADFDLPADAFGAPSPPPPETAKADQPEADAAAPESPAPQRRGGKLPIVMIDAGHGGKDVGATPAEGDGIPPGRYEKDITLAIARATAAALNRSGQVKALLTRDDDRFIPLGGRIAIARRAKADLFISIHADSAPNILARGASVYTLSETASDAVAARLAARENQSDIIAGVNLGVEAPGVGDIMIDLARRDTLNRSVAFAETLQRSLESRIGFRGEFHHFAGFYVLKAPDVPSVLLETGYVSNVEDARFLISTEGQAAIAQGIAQAVETFLRRGK